MGDERIAIVGIGETATARSLDATLPELLCEAVELAAHDAGLAISDIDGIVTETGFMPPHCYDIAASYGLSPDIFIGHTGLGGAGTIGSPALASIAIRSGAARNVLCLFGVKWGSETGAAYAYHSADPFKANLELPYGFFPQAAYMATSARQYLDRYGRTEVELAQVAIVTREWASLHPAAGKREPLSLDDYFASPLVADPLRNVDCCLLSDGAAAFIMSPIEVARDLRSEVIAVSGCGRSVEPITEHAYLSIRPDLLSLGSRISAPKAIERAGLTAAEIDVVEIYDCFSINTVIQLEDAGFCGRGEALDLYAERTSAPGGRLPVNTHGGLLSHSYLLGISHVCEAVTQLRHEAGDRQVDGARSAFVSGLAAMDHASLVLMRDG
ncbi:MAG: thiolase family protein [Acidimicrobiia bacterium]